MPLSSLDWPMANPGSAAHSHGMADLNASPAQSRELGLAAVAHLSRYRGTSREHTESDLRVFFGWCQDPQLAPLDTQRNDLELYLRWMQDVRWFKPSTVSRRLSVVAGFYRTCVIDGILEHSPADYVRRPTGSTTTRGQSRLPGSAATSPASPPPEAHPTTRPLARRPPATTRRLRCHREPLLYRTGRRP